MLVQTEPLSARGKNNRPLPAARVQSTLPADGSLPADDSLSAGNQDKCALSALRIGRCGDNDSGDVLGSRAM